MKIVFLTAKSIIPTLDGMGVCFTYTVNDEPTVYQFVAIAKVLNAWVIEEKERIKYKGKIFAAVVDFFKYYWRRYLKLPLQEIKHIENKDFRAIDETSLNWEGYTLNL